LADKKEAFHYVKVLHDLVLKTIDVDKAEAPPMAIVGNKVDLEREGQREVSTEEGQQLATGLGCLFFEASAKEMINVEETFLELTRAIRKRSKAQADAEADADGAAGGKKKKKKGRGSSIILKKQCLLF
jgi:GTPase SAR1 family protein